ncbi:MAG: response regulator transcription factor [Verrucomicrobia bacterium]|nr:response regulator transcription factor [Verrucomicrobiota bacterium]
MTRHTFLIVDDHPLLRRGIRSLLQSQPDFHVIGEAGDGLTALNLVALHRPDVVVLDIVMPMLGGLELLREMNQNQSQPPPRTIVLSLHDDEAYVQQAMRLGAAGYVLKHSASAGLIPAVREVLAGRFSCPVSGKTLPQPAPETSRRIMDRSELLTTEERMVLQMMAAGATEEQIAPKLGRQPLAIPILCRNIALKFGLREPADVRQLAAQWAREH